MTAPGRGRADGGSASIEFVTLGVLLLVPVVYLVVTLARIQAASFAADSGARAAARAFTTAPDDDAGRARALAAVRLALLDQGFDVDPAGVLALTCSAHPCLTPGARIGVQVEVRVVLPGVPAVLDRAVPTAVTVRAGQIAAVDRFRAAP